MLGVGLIAAREQPDTAQLFEKVLARIKASSIDPLPDSALFIKAARGLVRELNDPYADLYSPAQLAEFKRNALGNDYAGLGLGIEDLNDSVTVTAVFPGTPAMASGIQRGDDQGSSRWTVHRVIRVVDRQCLDTSQPAHRAQRSRSALIRAGVMSPVTVQMARAVVHVPSVPYALLFDGHVGYVPLLRVNETATAEIRSALKQASMTHGATAYVLDLRGNPGGQRSIRHWTRAAFFSTRERCSRPSDRAPLRPRPIRRVKWVSNAARPSWCSRMGIRRQPRKSLPAHCRTTTARSWSGCRPSGRDSCKR